MPDPMTTHAATDTGLVLRETLNLNATKRHWRDVTDIDDGDSPYTLLDTDEFVRADATSGAVTIDLPTASDAANRVLWVEAVNVTSTITLDPADAEQINGASTKTIGTAGRLVVLFCDGTDWTAWYMDRLP